MLLRLPFVLLILLTIAWRVQAVGRDDERVDDIATLVAPLAKLGLGVDGPVEAPAITITAPDCPVPVRVGMFFVTGGEDTLLRELLDPTVKPLYVYLGLVLDDNDHPRIFTRRVLGSIAALVGLRAKDPPKRLVVVALPDKCRQLAALNWATLSPWN